MANWIAGAVGKNPGGLHRSLGVPQGQKIPVKKIAMAATAPGRLGRQARLAQTLMKMPKPVEGMAMPGAMPSMPSLPGAMPSPAAPPAPITRLLTPAGTVRHGLRHLTSGRYTPRYEPPPQEGA